MQTTLFLSIATFLALTATSGYTCSQQNEIQLSSNTLQSKSWNDIRFGNWTEEDWYDNDYYRCIRQTFDRYLAGEIEFSDLDAYRELLPGKFIIYRVSPFVYGGLFIRIVFFDAPEDIFTIWVYSSVDEKKQEVVGYDMKAFKHEEGKSNLTKEEIERIMKEHPRLIKFF